MTKDTFHVGDVVEILPYEQVEDHGGLGKKQWDEVLRKCPLTVCHVSLSGLRIHIECTPWFFRPAALAHFRQCAVEVGDLL